MPFVMNKTGAIKKHVAFFHCMYKISPCCIVYEFISGAGQLGPEIYLKSSRAVKAHVRSLARTHVYCYNKNGQMIVDRKEQSNTRKMVAEKREI